MVNPYSLHSYDPTISAADSAAVTARLEAIRDNRAVYLMAVGGAAYLVAQAIKSSKVIEYPELGMEAIWKIEVEDFPAFILTDDKGNDFFKQVLT